MSRTFSSPWSHLDLWVNPDPPERWHRVVVLSVGAPVASVRERWPHAAAVILLEERGDVEVLVRLLLANPQVRVLVADGEVRGDSPVLAWLTNVWDGYVELSSTDLRACDAVRWVLSCRLFAAISPASIQRALDERIEYLVPARDRRGGYVLLPPPVEEE